MKITKKDLDTSRLKKDYVYSTRAGGLPFYPPNVIIDFILAGNYVAAENQPTTTLALMQKTLDAFTVFFLPRDEAIRQGRDIRCATPPTEEES